MTMRTVTGTIASPTGVPREGLQLDFTASSGETVSALTDAGGVFVIALEVDTPYAVGIVGACQIDGVPYPAGIVIRFTIPAGDEPVFLADVATSTMAGDWPALLARLEAVEVAIAALLPLAHGGTVAGTALADAAGVA